MLLLTRRVPGYRQQLQKDLSANRVRFAGVERNGSMVDNWHAGYPGYTLSAIAGRADKSLEQRPNVVLIHAGTNDMATGAREPYDQAPARLGKLVDQIHARLPDAVVLVSQLIHNRDPGQEARTTAFNDALPAVVKDLRAKGRKVRLVDFRGIRVAQLADSTHPNDAAYDEMGDLWYDALHAVPQDWFKPPVGPDPHINDPLPGK